MKLEFASITVQAGCKHVFVTRGAKGVLWATASGDRVVFEEMPAVPATPVSTRGAGASTTLACGWLLSWAGCERVSSHEGRFYHCLSIQPRLFAGDSFVAGTVWGLLQHSRAMMTQNDAVRVALQHGLRVAKLAVECDEAVPPTLSAGCFDTISSNWTLTLCPHCYRLRTAM